VSTIAEASENPFPMLAVSFKFLPKQRGTIMSIIQISHTAERMLNSPYFL
jgi:hypothetical protein